MNRTNPRLMAAIRHPKCPIKVVAELSTAINENDLIIRDRTEENKKLRGWLAFQERDPITEYAGKFRVFEINDGETHCVAAMSQNDAIDFIATFNGYSSVDEYYGDVGDIAVKQLSANVGLGVWDRDDTGELIVKTNAEWADVETHEFISTTCY